MFGSRIPKELHRKIFELTLALYRVTDFFPQGEVLRRQLREKANQVFGSITEYGFSKDAGQEIAPVLAKIESLKGYLKLARSMGLVKPINLMVLEREYDFFADFFHQEFHYASPQNTNGFGPAKEIRSPSTSISQGIAEIEDSPKIDERRSVQDRAKVQSFGSDMSDMPQEINERQKSILEHLKQTQQAKISDFYVFFNDISTKTIQRDLQDLVVKNLLRKDGEKRWTVYTLHTTSV